MSRRPTRTHDCGDPACAKNGSQTCALCDNNGPPEGVSACPACGRLPSVLGLPSDFASEQPCPCGGWWAVDGQRVAHSSPGCEEFSRMGGTEFVRARRAVGRPN